MMDKLEGRMCCRILAAVLLSFCLVPGLIAQDAQGGLGAARWISVPGIDAQGYGVYYFRKSLPLESVAEAVPVKVSADSRYMLYVNGNLVSQGPAKNDFKHWNYEQVDLAPYLKQGDNVVSACVFNEGPSRSLSHLSWHTAFFLSGEDEAARVWDTDASWLCRQDPAYSPLPTRWVGYFAVGPGEVVDMRRYVADWKDESCDLSSWQQSQVIAVPVYNNTPVLYGTGPRWQLQPSTLPQMEMSMQRIKEVRKANIEVPATFLEGNAPLVIPAHTEAVILLDQRFLTNAFVSLSFSGGNEATATLTYQESLYEKGNLWELRKTDRNKVEGMMIGGRKDSIICNGLADQQYTTLTWRTFRYIQMSIRTQEEPLVINDIYGTFTGYPFSLASRFDTDDEELEKILEIGWRTARLCATETYMDCPYYEQLQYLGDTRIQALVTLYNTRDDRLVRNFLTQADISRQPEGITLSRYPSGLDQIIPAYSLIYILALHDYMLYGHDAAFVAEKIPGTRQILGYYNHFQQEDGRVKAIPWWNFTDWVEEDTWEAGVAPSGADSCSAVTDLFLLLAYQAAAELEANYGMEAFRQLYEGRAEQLKSAVAARYWDSGRRLFADDAGHLHYSQHANALAILAGVLDGGESRSLALRILEDKTLSEASVYFKFYLDEALAHAGLGDDYLSWLDIYRENIRLGLTTWAEDSNVETTRSDCHAWGSSPNIELYRIVLGITSAAPQFEKVRIAPHLGTITRITGSIPWRDADISVSYEVEANRLHASIILPEGLTGTFVWNGKEYPLHGGENTVSALFK